MCIVKKKLPADMVKAAKQNNCDEYFLQRLKDNIPQVEYKYNLCFNNGYPAYYKCVSETKEYVYVDIIDTKVHTTLNIAISKKTLAFYCKDGQVTNAVHYLMNEARAILEMLMWDCLYKKN